MINPRNIELLSFLLTLFKAVAPFIDKDSYYI